LCSHHHHRLRRCQRPPAHPFAAVSKNHLLHHV
jgi:hypothetical protein